RWPGNARQSERCARGWANPAHVRNRQIAECGRSRRHLNERAHDAAHRQQGEGLDSQALAALGAACVDHGTATTGLHAHQETMGAGAAGLGSLVRTFHDLLDLRGKAVGAPCGAAQTQWPWAPQAQAHIVGHEHQVQALSSNTPSFIAHNTSSTGWHERHRSGSRLTWRCNGSGLESQSVLARSALKPSLRETHYYTKNPLQSQRLGNTCSQTAATPHAPPRATPRVFNLWITHQIGPGAP
ncbi:MAG: hypothetical protein RLZZ618_1319, partial [Pseudomonadota bacterium]